MIVPTKVVEPCRQELLLDIGNTPISLRTTGTDFFDLLRNKYRGFIANDLPPVLTFDLHLSPPGPYNDGEIEVSSCNGDWKIQRGDFCAEWNFETRQGQIHQSANPYSIDSVLRIVHTLALAREGGFLVHSASAIRNGKAFLFSGLSGAGKTTMTRLAPDDAVLLTDEISYVRKSEDGYRAFGTPFAGELGISGVNTSAPVAALYFLRKASSNNIEPMQSAEALQLLMRNILFFTNDSEMVSLVFQAACGFVSKVPAFWLSFYPDQRVWDLLG